MGSKTPLLKQTKHIDLPGQKVDLATGYDVTVILRKHRDVIFHFDLKSVKKIVAKVPAKSVPKSTMYDPKQKKLVKELTIPNGKPYPVWIGREFNTEISVYADDKLIGVYNPRLLDSSSVDPAPPFKPQPILIGFKEDAALKVRQCTADDPFGVGQVFQSQKPWLSDSLGFVSTLKDLQHYQYQNFLPDLAQPQRAVLHVVPPSTQLAQAMPEPGERAIPANELDQYLSPAQLQALAGSTVDSATDSAFFKSGADYVKDNRHWRERIMGQVRVKKVRGQLMLVWVGRSDPSKLKHLPGTTYGMANTKVAGVTGGYAIKSNQPFRRMVLSALQTTGNNAIDAMKASKAIKSVGLVLDVYGDYQKVFGDPKGSKDVTEFLGRAGVSLVAAGASAALGGVFAAVAVLSTTTAITAFGLASAPVAVVLAVGFGAFYVASWLIDNTIGSASVKDSVGRLAR